MQTILLYCALLQYLKKCSLPLYTGYSQLYCGAGAFKIEKNRSGPKQNKKNKYLSSESLKTNTTIYSAFRIKFFRHFNTM